MTIKSKPFDIADHLETEEDVRVFLQESAKNGTPDEFIHALGIVARAKGMTSIAEKAQVSRPSLYQSLTIESNPSFITVAKVLEAVGCRLSIR